MTNGPIGRLYEKLWEVFATDSEFANTFKPGNIKTYDDSEPMDKTVLQEADYPAIAIFPAGVDGLPVQVSTDLYTWDHSLSISLNTGKKGLDRITNIQWMLTRILMANMESILNDLWENEPYIICIKRVARLNLSNTVKAYGWNSVINLDVTIGISPQKLRSL
jgi:hypothetical protein